MKNEITTAQTLEALEKSKIHWDENLSAIGKMDSGEKFFNASIPMTEDHCALCTSEFTTVARVRGESCEDCPLGDCNFPDSLWQKVYEATTNHEAYTAATALRDKLIELRDEWAAKLAKEKEAEKPRFKVGDRVRATENCFCSYFKKGDIGTVTTCDAMNDCLVDFDDDGEDHSRPANFSELEPLPTPVIEVGDILVALWSEDNPQLGIVQSVGNTIQILDGGSWGYSGKYQDGLIESGKRLHFKEKEVLAALKYYRARKTK